jgi:hypothetical protein
MAAIARNLESVESITSSEGLSLAELDAEQAVELPMRQLMRFHRSRVFFRRSRFVRFNRFDNFNRFNRFNGLGFNRFNRFNGLGFNRFGGTGAFASFGSVANANSTFQSNFNPQIAIGGFGGGGARISSFNSNFNNTSQFGAPVNFGFGGF